jgi:leader peptidase (prepilin peptidase)/N-methyltransferase
MLLIIIISDYQTMIIPDSILIVFGVLIIVIKYFIVGYPSILYSLLDGVIAFIFMLLLKLFGDFIFKKESMGGGDIKLMFIFGVMFGYAISIFSVFIAAVIGLPISLILLKRNKSHEIPFGPFLAVAAIVILFTKLNFDTLINLLIIK